ncbi:hypothetical protein ACI3PL_30960, partial [Lacticaseibacillus paracasei]
MFQYPTTKEKTYIYDWNIITKERILSLTKWAIILITNENDINKSIETAINVRISGKWSDSIVILTENKIMEKQI